MFIRLATGDERVRGEAVRLLIVVDGLRRPDVPPHRREASDQQLHQPVRKDQVHRGGVCQGRLQIGSGY